MRKELLRQEILSAAFSLALANAKDPWQYEKIGSFDRWFNVTAHDRYPDFAGKMRYTFSFDLSNTDGRIALDLGTVGEVAELKLNGTDMGIRICAPYEFDISSAVKLGENTVELTVSNTLVRQNHDSFSYFMQIPPSGLLGEVTLKFYQ